MNDFPDIAQLLKLREMLWNGSPVGNASVMIGSGFSRNAIPISKTEKPFPTWNELGEALASELFPPIKPCKASSNSSHDLLYLAYQYELVFGRGALEALIKKVIPDSRYMPSDLHEKLLHLPWRDVFTTNYDTLLERASSNVRGVAYQTIHTSNDLPGSSTPRIIKLHGTLPSHTPFIVTEEDFRTYSSKFAPLVNCVQQAMVETAFCLIGFSGDDPNFKRWIGWVRDNLKQNAPHIYICGVLELNDIERLAWVKQNLIPIDLSPIVSSRRCSSRHYEALKWLLDFFRLGEPPDFKKWPNNPEPPIDLQAPYLASNVSAGNYIPLTEPSPPQDELDTDGFPIHSPYTRELIIQLIEHWENVKNAYPGWIIAPPQNRSTLTSKTNRWLPQIIMHPSNLTNEERLRFYDVLVWRLNVSLEPISEVLVSEIEPFLQEFDPFTQSYSSQCHNRERWLNLAFSMLRHAREHRHDDKFREWEQNILAKPHEWVLPFIPNLKYEKCLWYLPSFNLKQIRILLDTWPEHEDPFWQVRKSAVLESIGDVELAEQVVLAAIDSIGGALKHDKRKPDYYHLSRHGWALFQLKGIYARSFRPMNEKNQRISDQLEELTAFRSNPEHYLNYALRMISAPYVNKNGTVERQFDIGRFTENIDRRTFDSSTYYSFFKLLDDSAVVPSYMTSSVRDCSTVLLQNNEVRSAWCYLLQLNSTSPKDLNRWLTPESLRNIDKNDLGYLFKLTFQRFQRLISERKEFAKGKRSYTNLDQNLARTIELMSRLVVCLPDKSRRQVFRELIALYQDSLVTLSVSQKTSLSNLAFRLFDTMSDAELSRELPNLVVLPLKFDDQFKNVKDPFCFLLYKNNFVLSSNDKAILSAVDRLLDSLNGKPDSERIVGLLRLERLHSWKMLTSKQEARFGELIWNNSNRDKVEIAGLLRSRLLFCPAPVGENIIQYVKDYILQLSEALHDEQLKRSWSYLETVVFREIITSAPPCLDNNDDKSKVFYVRWNIKELDTLRAAIEAWWSATLSRLKNPNTQLFSSQSRASESIHLVGGAIIALIRSCEKIEDCLSFKKIITEWISSTHPFYRLASAGIVLDALDPVQASKYLRNGLSSPDYYNVTESLFGIVDWLSLRKLFDIPPPDELLDLMFYKARLVAELSTGILLQQLNVIVDVYPEYITTSRCDSLLSSFQHLLHYNSVHLVNSENILTTDILLYATRLSQSLKRYYIHNEIDVPQVILDWEQHVSKLNIRYLLNALKTEDNCHTVNEELSSQLSPS